MGLRKLVLTSPLRDLLMFENQWLSRGSPHHNIKYPLLTTTGRAAAFTGPQEDNGLNVPRAAVRRPLSWGQSRQLMTVSVDDAQLREEEEQPGCV